MGPDGSAAGNSNMFTPGAGQIMPNNMNTAMFGGQQQWNQNQVQQQNPMMMQNQQNQMGGMGGMGGMGF